MKRLLKMIVIFALPIGLSLCTQASKESSEAQEVKAVVERFCKLEAAGTWLGTSQWNELQDFFTEIGPATLPASVSVLKRYQIGETKRIVHADGTVHYGVDVDWFEWGSINSFLRFTRASATGQPVERRVGESLFLTDRLVTTGPTGNEEKKKVSRRWRMRDFDRLDRVDVDTAISWVSQMRDKSNEPAVKYNAENTLAILKNLSAGTPLPSHSVGTAPESALRFAQRFVQMESRLTPDQWDELENFFVETPRPQWNKVYVVDVLHVDTDIGGETHDDSSEVAISVRPLGELDSSLSLSTHSRLPGNNNACCGGNYLGFTLLLSEKHWQIASNGTVKEFDGPLAWRIEDTLFRPFITLDTAIRYVTQTRDKSTNLVIKKNGEETIAKLKSLH
jgi:hypothetical protein